MTLDEATVQIHLECPWFSDQDLATFLSPEMSSMERTMIVRVYKNAGVPAQGASLWATIFKVLAEVSAVAGLIIPIAGAVSTVYGIEKM